MKKLIIGLILLVVIGTGIFGGTVLLAQSEPIAPSSDAIISAPALYEKVELVGTSTESWEAAARVAVEQASKTFRYIQAVEVVSMDLLVIEGKVVAYRTTIKVTHFYNPEDQQ